MSARSATTGPGSAPLSRPTTPVWRHPGAHLVQAQRAQVIGDHAGGAELAVAEFGVLMQVAPPGDDGGFDAHHRLVDGGGDGTALQGGLEHLASCNEGDEGHCGPAASAARCGVSLSAERRAPRGTRLGHQHFRT